MIRRWISLAALAVALGLMPLAAAAQTEPGAGKAPGMGMMERMPGAGPGDAQAPVRSTPEPSRPMPHMAEGMARPASAPPVYGEGWLLALIGLAVAAGGVVAYRAVRARRRAPAEVRSEAVLVADLADSTHFATHYGEALGMQARNLLKERALAAAQAQGVEFVESTGDGYLMTFSAVGPAGAAAIALLRGLVEDPLRLDPAPPLAARAAVTYGEILLDARGQRHGSAMNKAFRLLAVGPENFVRVEGEEHAARVPDRNRIFLDEAAAGELRDTERSPRFVGFCRLKGFPGLHRVYELPLVRDASGRADPVAGREERHGRGAV